MMAWFWRDILLLLAVPVLWATTAWATPLRIWHSYRGAEQRAFERTINLFELRHPGSTVEVVALPYEAMASKLTAAIPTGNGPDLFVFAHERLGSWVDEGLLLPLDGEAPVEAIQQGFVPETLSPLRYRGRLWGLPLAFKCVGLIYNRALVPTPPASLEQLVDTARLLRARDGHDRYGLAYLADNFYFHAPVHLAMGGPLPGADGMLDFASPGSVQGLRWLQDLIRNDLLPRDLSASLLTQLFNAGHVAMVLNGPWFLGEVESGIDVGVAPIPPSTAMGRPSRSLLTDEGLFVSALSRKRPEVLDLAVFLAGDEAARVRAVEGRQLVARSSIWQSPELRGDPALQGFRQALTTAVALDPSPATRRIWEPAGLALRKIVRGDSTPEQAAQAAQRRLAAVSNAHPPPANPWVLGGILILAAGLWIGWRRGRRGPAIGGPTGALSRIPAADVWWWTGPAALTTGVLVMIPLVTGFALSVWDRADGVWNYVGAAHFIDILLSRRFPAREPLSFYYALFVTVLWTICNLVLHVGIGLGLALLLNRSGLRLRALYRVLLVLPWAVPNYVTALLWKGLFHAQYGAINALLTVLGMSPVQWWNRPQTAFFANVCANAWLGFPFMMVVCLGALQAIPREMQEVAELDGASPWQRFRHVTWPLLQPALIPAILLGTVWTFNQFNVVYLVSGGEPEGATDILVSEAYRWAFSRQEQYGYAAAYSVLIFVLLSSWNALSARLRRRWGAPDEASQERI